MIAMGAPLKIPSTLDRQWATTRLGLLASFCLIVGLLFGYLSCLHPLLRSRAAQSWVETPCEIISSEVDRHTSSKGSVSYSLNIVYDYQQAGKNYRSNRYDFTFGSSSHFDWQEAVVSQNYPGRTTVCYVNPQDPTDAVMSRSFEHDPMANVLFLILPLTGLGMLLPIIFEAVRKKKFGESIFELDDAPIPIGGIVSGTVMLSRIIQPRKGFSLRFACIRQLENRGRGVKRFKETTLLEAKRQVMSDDGLTVPVNFTIPENATETKTVSNYERIIWRVDVSAKMPGVDYKAQFEVPVAKTEA